MVQSYEVDESVLGFARLANYFIPDLRFIFY